MRRTLQFLTFSLSLFVRRLTLGFHVIPTSRLKGHAHNTAVMSTPAPGSREDDLASKIELLRSAKKQGLGYEKFLEKSKGQTLSSTLQELNKTEGGKVTAAEDLKMKKEKQMYADAVDDVSELNTGILRRAVSEKVQEDNADIETEFNPDEYLIQSRDAAKKTAEEATMNDLEKLIFESQGFFDSKSALDVADQIVETNSPSKENAISIQTTSGIGGSWSPAEAEATDVETHKPKVSTWGVFERPKDISKAFGGGRRVGIGGYQMSPEEQAKKDEEIEQLLREVQLGSAEEVQKEEEHAAQIDAAIARSAKLLKLGDSHGVVEELQAVKAWCNPRSERGSKALIEYGMALELIGERSNAAEVYTFLLSKSKIPKIQKNARALLAGIEAFTNLKFDTKEVKSEWIWDFPEIKTDIMYNTNYYQEKDADGMLSSETPSTVKDAKNCILQAIKYREGINPSRVLKAVDFFNTRSEKIFNMTNDGQEIPESWITQIGPSNTVPARMEGEWALGIAVKEKALEYTGSGSLKVIPESLKLKLGLPAGLLLFEQEGTFLYTSKDRSILFSPEICRVSTGLFTAPWVSSTAKMLQVLFLDEDMCILKERGVFETEAGFIPRFLILTKK